MSRRKATPEAFLIFAILAAVVVAGLLLREGLVAPDGGIPEGDGLPPDVSALADAPWRLVAAPVILPEEDRVQGGSTPVSPCIV